MGKRIIKLTESDLYRIVKRVINEQEEESEENSYFSIPIKNGELCFKIINGRIWLLDFDKNGLAVPVKNLNGVLSDFKVDYKTKEVIGDEFKDNFELVKNHWLDFNRIPGALPRETEFTYKFLALVPPNSPSKNVPIGAPIIYTAEIGMAPSKNHYKNYRGYSESKNGEVGQYVYYKTGGDAYLLNFSSGAYVMSYNSGKPKKPVHNEKPFELNIESPFEFDKVTLTNDAKSAFNKFIELVKENYVNVQGDVEVICSASIDGAPDQKRIDYDMNLSKKRAEAIVSILKSNLPGTKLNFIPKGIGQTDKFATGKKFPEVKDINQTAPNRRLIIKLPQIMK